MERYSDEAFRDAWLVQCDAEKLAGVKWYHLGRRGLFAVLPQWTAWLLMEKAGVPCDLIATMAYVDLRQVRHGLLVTKALLVWPPYAARIEGLMRQMPRHGAAHGPALQPAKEGRCAARLG